MAGDLLTIAGKTFESRLIIGTGKYVMRRAHAASGAEMVTVAVRRVDLDARDGSSLLDHIDRDRYALLPNTAGCYSAEEAVRTARLGRAAGLTNWVKLEVIGDERTLFPDNEALLAATRTLAAEGFVVLPYTNDDPIICRKLADAGAAAVMPLGAPIGSGLGVQNRNNLAIIREQARVPVIVDAGVGTPSDAAVAMELGADGVLINTAWSASDGGARRGEVHYLAGASPVAARRATRSTSASTILRTSPAKSTDGRQPSSAMARDGSPTRCSTSAGRISAGSVRTCSRQSRPACENAVSTRSRTEWLVPVAMT